MLFRSKEIHLTLLRFSLAELDIVKSRSGQTNIFSFTKMPHTKSGAPAPPNFKKQTGYDFRSIDELNVSFGKAKYIDLQNPHNNREQTIGLSNCVVPDVKSMNDLAGVALLVGLRSNHFFDPLIAKPKNPAAVQSILDIIGVSL